MTVLITGAAGFIGSHVADSYLGAGCNVIGLDDLSTGDLDNVPARHDKYQFVLGSILDHRIVSELVESSDVVVHLAARVGVARVVSDALGCWTVNTEGTRVVLEAAVAHNRRCLIASSSEVYGFAAAGPLRESGPIELGSQAGKRAVYAYSKVAAELLARTFWEVGRLPVTILRLFNTIGPRQRPEFGMVVPRFIQQALNGDPLTVVGAGFQCRCFSDVETVADSIRKLADCSAAVGRTVNVGNNQEISVRDLAELVVALAGSVSPIYSTDSASIYGEPVEDYRCRVPDPTVLTKLIGSPAWEDIHDTLRRTIAWRRDTLTVTPRLDELRGGAPAV